MPYVNTDTDALEQIVRDFAGTVLSLVANRIDHPSYGVTKSNIRDALARMDGAIGMYMVLTEQANHPQATALVKFVRADTKEIVRRAKVMAATRVGVVL